MERKLSNSYYTKYISVSYRRRFFAININNFNKYNNYDLVGDTVKIAEENGFEIENVHTLKNITRCHGHKEWNVGECGWHDNDEKIIVFRKKENAA